MKSSRKRSGKSSPSKDESVKKSTRKRRSRRQHSKATDEKKILGHSENLVVDKDNHSSPSSDEGLRSRMPNKGECLAETAKRLPLLPLCPGHTLDPSAKIKLQLFPIDKGTQIGLEKDGFHPYLELTLSAWKKISSVLKHLSHKWGRSSIAIGEPALFPYSTLENSAGYQWTSNDRDISAGDVYAAIGSPPIFRLRYGWFSGAEYKTSGVPPTDTPSEAYLQTELTQRGSCANMENAFRKGKQTEVTNEELNKPGTMSEASIIVNPEKMSSNESGDPKDNEERMDIGIGQSSMVWPDGLTNISIGGLLSEASLQGKLYQYDPKSNGRNAVSQPAQLILDSFDAFVASQLDQSRGPKLPTLDTCSSILDAEDTCHAFAFQKNSSSGKDALTFGQSASSQICSQDEGSKLFKFPNLTETNSIQSGLPRGHCQESETDLQLCSRVYNDESSLGLSGIKWMDSLGPFDLGLS